MWVTFEKWHAAKNDFVVVWTDTLDDAARESLRVQVPRLCARDGTGIGADGVLACSWIDRSSTAPAVAVTIVNHDGSMAATCGNGIRCLVLSAMAALEQKASIVRDFMVVSVMTPSGRNVECRQVGRKNAWNGYVFAEMGSAGEIEGPRSWVEEVESKVAATGGIERVTTLSFGNEHCVALGNNVDGPWFDVLGRDLQALGGGRGINFHSVRIRSEAISDREQSQARAILGEPIEEVFVVTTYERGVGRTRACGSGACAVVESAISWDVVAPSQWVALDMPGGRLYVRRGDDAHVTLVGPAERTFEGRFEI